MPVPELEELLVGVPELVELEEEVPVPVGLAEREEDQELLPVLLALAPAVREAVALALTVLEALWVVEGVGEEVPVPLPLLLLVPVEVGVTVPELEAEEPGESVAVGEPLSVEHAVTVLMVLR